MVVGRATNGFEPEFTVQQLVGADDRRKVIDGARFFAEHSDPEGPLGWVQKKTKSQRRPPATVSPFWRVTRKLLQIPKFAEYAASATARDFQSYVTWTNLAKVAPAVGGNPRERLWKAQRDVCAKLLRQEIREFRPAAVAVIADECWYAEFLRKLGLAIKGITPPSICEVVPGDPVWILTRRPERRPESPFVDDMAQSLAQVRS
ncbi:MAG: hypothetical protein NVSMB53_12740 [Gemmatimonadaceae bacterium]